MRRVVHEFPGEESAKEEVSCESQVLEEGTVIWASVVTRRRLAARLASCETAAPQEIQSASEEVGPFPNPSDPVLQLKYTEGVQHLYGVSTGSQNSSCHERPAGLVLRGAAPKDPAKYQSL